MMLDSKVNLIGFIQQGRISNNLTEDEFGKFCREIEDKFDIRSVSRLEQGIIYKLHAGVNSMRWVDGAEISIIRRGKMTDIRYAISTTTSTLFLLLFSVVWPVISAVAYGISFDAFIPLFITLPVLITTAFVAKVIFRLRIRRALKRVILNRVMISDEQQAWIKEPGRCPACGRRVNGESSCPECGLTLIEK